MKAYKGFDKDLKCRSFQYEVGGEYEEQEASICRKGFHACENPLDTLRYYRPGDSRYCEVELEDNGQRNGDDSKVCGKKIKIGAEIGLDGVIEAGARFIFEKCEGVSEDRASGENGNAAASGWSGNAAASGVRGTATVTGAYGGARALGHDCLAVAWGPESKAMGKLGNWLVLSEHENGTIVDAQMVRIDGDIIKPDTWYMLRNGEPVEVEE